MSKLFQRWPVAIAIAMTALSGASWAQDDEGAWVDVADTKTVSYSIDAKSVEYVRTAKSGLRALWGKVRVTSKDDNSSKFEGVYVLVRDCINQQGDIATTSVNGTFRYSNSFKAGSTTVAAGLAEALCEVHSGLLESHEKTSRRPTTPSEPMLRNPAPVGSSSKDKSL